VGIEKKELPLKMQGVESFKIIDITLRFFSFKNCGSTFLWNQKPSFN
jgi:hypothetical protein